MNAPYLLHIGNKNYSSWSLRPWLLMKGLGIPFEESFHRFVAGGSRAAFKAFSPVGLVPCLHHGGRVVWDSLAIMEYLAERHPGVWPKDEDARAYARSVSAEMHASFSTLRNICGMSVGIRVTLKDQPPALTADIARIDQIWSEGTARFGGPFLAGAEFSAADAMFGPVAFRVQTYGLSLSPAARAYNDRLLALPAMKEWEQAALAEDFRDPDHESEWAQFGSLIEDLRAPVR